MAIIADIIKQGIHLRARMRFELLLPIQHQRNTLRKLLSKAQNTDFGRTYNFQKLLLESNITEAYKQAVPTCDYNSIFAKWWYRLLQEEENVTWPGRVKYFALSSGTSEQSSKHIPITKDMMSAIKRAGILEIISLDNYSIPGDMYTRRSLMLGGSTHLNRTGNYYIGDLSGISAKNLPFWFRFNYKPGRRIASEKDWEEKLEKIVRMAKHWDIGHVAGVPAWVQILFERIIEHYQVDTVHDIWPHLALYTHSGVAIEPYKKGFEKLFGKPVQFIDTYLASEGFIAYRERPESEGMRLLLSNGIYYEFVPFNEHNFDGEGNMIERPEVLAINEVEEGKDYAILLTTCAGAWRYLIGDTVRFTDVKRAELIISGRTKSFLSLCGEHLSIDNMNKAIEMIANEYKIQIKEYTVAGEPYKGLFAHHWFIGTDSTIDADVFRKRLDAILCELNDDYAVERTAALKEVLVDVLPTKMFYDWMEKNHKMGAQNKFPRVLKGERLADWRTFIREQQPHIKMPS